MSPVVSPRMGKSSSALRPGLPAKAMALTRDGLPSSIAIVSRSAPSLSTEIA